MQTEQRGKKMTHIDKKYIFWASIHFTRSTCHDLLFYGAVQNIHEKYNSLWVVNSPNKRHSKTQRSKTKQDQPVRPMRSANSYFHRPPNTPTTLTKDLRNWLISFCRITNHWDTGYNTGNVWHCLSSRLAAFGGKTQLCIMIFGGLFSHTRSHVHIWTPWISYDLVIVTVWLKLTLNDPLLSHTLS